MRTTARLLALLVTPLLLATPGCDRSEGPVFEEQEELELPPRDTRSGVETRSDPDGGIWINNGLDDPDVSGVDPEFSLESADGLDPMGDLLAHPARRDTVEYLVECSLSEGSSITKVVDDETLVFEGLIGLAPEWQRDSCDLDCQEWVSACLLARTNTSGEVVTVWFMADHPAVGTDSSSAFPIYEASFFGNLFLDAEQQYMCEGNSGVGTVAFLAGRTCTGDPESCDFTSFSGCRPSHRCEFTQGQKPAAIGCTPDDGVPRHTITTYITPPPH